MWGDMLAVCPRGVARESTAASAPHGPGALGGEKDFASVALQWAWEGAGVSKPGRWVGGSPSHGPLPPSPPLTCRRCRCRSCGACRPGSSSSARRGCEGRRDVRTELPEHTRPPPPASPWPRPCSARGSPGSKLASDGPGPDPGEGLRGKESRAAGHWSGGQGQGAGPHGDKAGQRGPDREREAESEDRPFFSFLT